MEKTLEITEAIAVYATAYRQLNKLQKESPEYIPQGDQKTGAIGEFYANLFVQATYPEADIAFGGNSNKAWDIKVEHNGTTRLIQVKTISAFSKTGKLSPIHHGWDELYILHLDEDLQPNGFWVINDSTIIEPGETFRECYGPRPSQHFKQSGKLVFSIDRIDLLRDAINRTHPGILKTEVKFEGRRGEELPISEFDGVPDWNARAWEIIQANRAKALEEQASKEA